MNELGIILLGGLLIALVIAIPTALWIPDHHAKQLANAICEDMYGTEFKDYEFNNDFNSYTIEGITCKEPVKAESKYDGLFVRID